MNRRTNRRKGMSLLEVLLALAVFLMSITGLVYLMGIASDSALEAQMRSQAMSLCQSRLAEASCGAIPLESHDKTTSEDDDAYEWSMDVDSGSFDGLHNVTVTVTRKRANGTELECSLSQMILDPSIVGTVFDSAKELMAPSTDSSATPDPATAADTTGAATSAGSTSKSGSKSDTKSGSKTSGKMPSTKTGGTPPSTKTGGTPPSTKTGGMTPSTTPSTSSKTGG